MNKYKNTIQKTSKHPKALYLLFFTEMWERFSFYGMRAILVLYLTKSYLEGGLGVDKASASLLYGQFLAGVYLTPIIGGFLADRYLGKRNAIMLGGLLMFLGQLCMFAINSYNGAIAGLVLLAMGNGFFKPNISSLLGEFYDKNDPRKDGAFSLFYMSINIGAFIAPLVIGFAVNSWFSVSDASGQIISHGYKYGFLCSAIGIFFGQMVFQGLMKKYLEDKGMKPVFKYDEQGKKIQTYTKLTIEEIKKMIAIVILSLTVIVFWVGFEQAGSSLTLYTESYTNRTIGNFVISTEWFQSLNPLFVVILAPLFSIFWVSKMGKVISTPVKMGMGIIFLGVGFIFMLGAIYQRGGDISDTSIKASMLWMVFVYFFHTMGELCLSPIGLSAVSKLSPARFASLMMGIWFISTGIANYLSGFVASYMETLGALNIFLYLAIISIIVGSLLILLSPFIQKLMGDIK